MKKILPMLLFFAALSIQKVMADTQPGGPTTTPKAPTAHPNDVLAVFSDNYVWGIEKIVGVTNGGSCTKSELTIGDLKVTMFNVKSTGSYSDLQFRYNNNNNAYKINLSDYETLEMDVYSCGYNSNGVIKDINLKVGLGTITTQKITTLPTGQWQHLSINLSTLANGNSIDGISQIRVYLQTPNWGNFAATHNANVYIYNIYFKKATTTGAVADNVKVTVPVSAAGWASACFPYPVVCPEGVNAYYATTIDSETITLEQITDAIPANEGVLINATGDVVFSKVANATAIDNNLFEGTTCATLVTENENYVLSGVENEMPYLQLYANSDAGTGNICMPAFKAYLPKSKTTAGARKLKFVFESDATTGITEIESDKTVKSVKKVVDGRMVIEKNGVKYNAAGQKVINY